MVLGRKSEFDQEATYPPPFFFKLFIYFFFLKIFFFNVYLFLRQRERQSMNGGGAEREGDTELEAGSRLWAISPEPDAGLKLTDREIVTWAEVGPLTDWATQAPQESILLFSSSVLGWGVSTEPDAGLELRNREIMT